MNTDRRGFLGLIGAIGGAALVPWTKQKPKPVADPVAEIDRAIAKSFDDIDARGGHPCYKEDEYYQRAYNNEVVAVVSYDGRWEHVIDAATCACVKCGIGEWQLHEQGAFSVTGVKAYTVRNGFKKLTTYTVWPRVT